MGILDDADAYVEFLTKNRLSTNQFLLLYLLYTEQMFKIKTKTDDRPASELMNGRPSTP